MGAFDPDAWLAKKEQQSSATPTPFDPDAWLAKREPAAAAPVVPAKKEERPEDQSFLRGVADVPLKIAGGVTTGVRMIADAFGADTSVGKTLRNVEGYIADLYSAQSKKDSQEIARIMKEAEDKGVLDQVAAGIKAFSVAPVDMLSNALGTAAPAIVAGLATTLGGAPAVAATAARLGVGAMMGAGTTKGAIYDATKEILKEKTNLSDKEIEVRAVAAQEYGGKNLDQILIGTGLGALGSATAVEPMLARQLAKGIASKESVKEAIKQASAKETATAAKRGVIKQGAITGGKELATEFPQGAQEQLAQNIAQQREGFDTPTMRGVVGQGTLEGLAGLGMGAITGGREAYTAKRELAAEKPADETLKSQFTTETETKKREVVAPTADDIGLLTPITDTSGKSLVDAASDTLAAKEKADADAAAKAAEAKVSLDEATAKANELLAKADAGTAIKQTEYRPVAKALGIKIPFGTSNAAAVELIRAHLAQQGAPSVTPTGTDESTTGTSTGMAGQPSAVSPSTDTQETDASGVVSTRTTAGAATTGKRTQPASVTPAAAPVGTVEEQIAKLDPTVQAEIKRRRDEIADIEMDGGDASKKKATLNKLLAKQGITGTLAARKSIEKDFLDEGELPVALPGEEKTEQELEAERVAAYNESLVDEEGKPRTIPKYDISEEDKRLYNETREEVNSQVEAANKRRRELVAAVDKAADEFDKAEEGKAENDAWDRLTAAEKALKEHGEEQHMLPEYEKKFAADYKDVYFGKIKYGNKAEHRAAAKALQAYMREMRGRSKEQMSTEERRIANAYNENRAEYSKIFGVSFPRWADLTAEQKALFKSQITTLAGAQQDVAFALLGTKLIRDSRELSEGEKREKQNIIDRQVEVRQKSEAQQERDRKTRESYERNKPSYSSLPNAVLKMVMNNDVQGVLKYLSEVKTAKTSPYKQLLRLVAKSLYDMKLNTQIKIVDASEIEGDLARYDPVSDTIFITQEGLSTNTILHEVVHAGTVKVINEYLYGNRKSLSMAQLYAVRQLERIMEATKASLEVDHPEAYKNLFEFVSYALTSDQLQQDLHDTSDVENITRKVSERAFGDPSREVGTNLPESKSMWSSFKMAVAGILKLKTSLFGKGKTLNEKADVNYVMEIAAAFEDILVKPTEPVYLPALPSKAKPQKATTDVEEGEKQPERVGGINDPKNREFYKPKGKEKITSKTGEVWKAIRTATGWRDIVRRFQDKSVESRSLHKKLDMAGRINRDMNGAFNNFDEQRDLSTGMARNFVNQYLRQPMDSIKQSIGDYAKLTKKSIDEVTTDLHMFAEMFHEPERRHFKWLRSVPLSTKQNLMHNGKKISAAERRIDILGDPRTGKPGIVDRVELTKDQQKQLRAELEYLAKNFADPIGDSPRIKSDKVRERLATRNKKAGKLGIMDINEDASVYNVLGINKAEVDLRMSEYKAMDPEQRKLLDKIFADAKVITDNTAKLDKIGNYWSFPVSNLVGLYDYKHYMPFKGISKHSVVDQYLSFDSEATGKDLQDIAHSADGRFSVSDNPFLQMMSDAFRSAGRAGRRDYMQSIKNAVKPNKYNPTGTGVIDGEVAKHIEFAERNIVDLTEFKGGSNIFVYNPDGSIDIIRIKEPKILNALRYSFRDASPMLDMANSVTGFFGAMHTRYNYNFAPLNFVRDALTNAWNIGASKLGPAKSLTYIKQISAAVVKNGLGKGMEVALLREKGDPTSNRILADMAAKDPFVRDMLEYLRFGGKTTYLESFSLKSSLQDLNTKLGKRRIMDNVDSFNQFVDVWNDMFEFTSRAAAYSLYKQEVLKKNIADGMSNEKGPNGEMSPAEVASAWEAAAWTKNLANFEKAGEYAREMGALYMFIRASATGAVRAAEAAIPAFRSMKSVLNDLPPEITGNKEALEKFKKEYALEQRNARVMISALIGMGFFAYWMASLMAPDDEWKRNNVKHDNMQQWTRFARFHIPNEVSQQLGIGRDVVFQLPWGFGLGAFAAIGAQLAGLSVGNNSVKDALSNTVTSLSDSFLPIPVSKIPPLESPESSLKWAADTVTPTVFRPVLEYLMNTNGIGQAINSAQNRRMGDAFTGGDRIPEIYKQVAKGLFNSTSGAVDWSPNTLYFFSNSYLDGLAKVAEIGYSWTNLSKGEKEFNLKQDVPFLGSFFGTKTNVDSREYGNIETRIKELDKRLSTLDEVNPAKAAMYDAENPLSRALIDAYKSRQGELNALRAEANQIRNMSGLSPKSRDAMLRMVVMQQNILKHQMVMDFKAYGEKP